MSSGFSPPQQIFYVCYILLLNSSASPPINYLLCILTALWFTSLLLLLLLRASKGRRWNNLKGTNLRYRSKYLYWMRNTIILVCDHWYRDSLRLKKIIVLKQLESLNPESVT